MIGSAIGGYFDPEHIKGPSLGDIPVQTSQEGVPRPIVYGAPQPFGGNIIQTGPLIRVTKEERQGKGGPVLETEEVYQTYAIRICEGPATVLTVWRDGRVIFDRSGLFPLDADSAAFASKALFYTGDETQMPDPSLEALPAANGGGIGNVPAYRGTAYMVVVNDNLTPTGGRIPQYQFRMASSATVSETCSEDGLILWYPLDDAAAGGVARELVQGLNGVYSDTDTIGGGPAQHVGAYGSVSLSTIDDYMVAEVFGISIGAPGFTMSAWCTPLELSAGSVLKNVGSLWQGPLSGTTLGTLCLDGTSDMQATAIRKSSFNQTVLQGDAVQVTGSTLFLVSTWEQTESGNGTARLYVNGSLVDEQLETVQPLGSGASVAVGGWMYPASYGFIGYVGDLKVYNYALNQSEILERYLTANDWIELPDAPGNFVNVATGEVVRACTSSAQTGTVYLSAIEADIADRCGVSASQFDVSADTAVEVEGFLVNKQMAGADALRSLGMAFFRDYPEYDRQIVSTPRGLPSVVTLTDDDFVDSEEDEETRGQAIERPRKLNLFFSDPAASFAVVPVPAERTSSDVPATSVVGMEVPLVMDRNDAARRADIILKCIWEEAQGTLIRELPGYEFAYLTAADCVQYGGKRWRIDKLDQLDGTIKIEAKRDRISNYTSNATANTTVTPTAPVSAAKGPTILRVLNLPRLTTQQDKPGVYFGLTGLLDGWSGADLYLSTDGGATEEKVGTYTARATMGTLAQDATASGEPLVVRVFGNRELSSITDAQMAARMNGFALTSSDVSEVCQFQTANEDADGNWELTDVLRGQLATTAASHTTGDDFLLLDGSIYFLPIDISYAGSTLIFRAPTRGTPKENAPTVSLLYAPQFTGLESLDPVKADGVQITVDGTYLYLQG